MVPLILHLSTVWGERSASRPGGFTLDGIAPGPTDQESRWTGVSVLTVRRKENSRVLTGNRKIVSRLRIP